jgi:hypothetical protein
LEQDLVPERHIDRQQALDVLLGDDAFRQSLLVWWQDRTSSVVGFASRYRVLQQKENKLFTAAKVRTRETGASPALTSD